MPASDSVCICPEEALSWKRITNPWNESIHVSQSPCARLKRWVLRLRGYDFKVVYRPGKTNIADALSRLNSVKQLDCGEEYDFIRAVVESCVPVALSLKEIEEASYDDDELWLVKNCVKSGNWVQCTIPSYTHVKDVVQG